MNTRSVQSILYRNFFIFLCALITAMALIISVKIKSFMREVFVQDNTDAATFLSANLESVYEQNLRAADDLASLLGGLQDSPESSRILMDRFLELRRFFNRVVVYKATGEVLLERGGGGCPISIPSGISI